MVECSEANRFCFLFVNCLFSVTGWLGRTRWLKSYSLKSYSFVVTVPFVARVRHTAAVPVEEANCDGQRISYVPVQNRKYMCARPSWVYTW